jgi:hypothetical protein
VSDTILRVEKLAYGFEVEICDPTIVAENEKPKSNYKSPWVEYAFTTAPEVIEFIKLHLESLKPEPDEDKQYGQEFARQAAAMDSEAD